MKKKSLYEKYGKRFLDVTLSFMAIIVLSPIFLLLIILGIVFMRGNPFFIQERPGKNEKIFKLIKFRTMDNRRDKKGNFLPDEIRLNKYGRFLRSTSLDEIPEIINILIGDMSIIGPRPLSIKYIPYYTEIEHHRHDVRPGLSGLAQVKGRNSISWEEKFAYDLQYISHITFYNDFKIIIETIVKVLKRENIGQAEEAPISLSIERMKR